MFNLIVARAVVYCILGEGVAAANDLLCRLCWGCVAGAAGAERPSMAAHAQPCNDSPHLWHHS